jgi:hypothetical protein
MKGQRAEKVKLTTKVRPPLKKITLPSAGGSHFRYQLAAMIKHHGKK